MHTNLNLVNVSLFQASGDDRKSGQLTSRVWERKGEGGSWRNEVPTPRSTPMRFFNRPH